MKPWFEPEEFKYISFYAETPHEEQIANIVNEKLDRILESLPTVFGHMDVWSNERDAECTLQAKLICIEKINRPCEHEPEPHWAGQSPLLIPPIKCRICGDPIVPRWELAK